MAYNPFNIFRRNQKLFFAILTVFIMLIFTLSSGVMGGDFFEVFTQWLGSKSRKGDAVCTIDGDKIYEGELQKLAVNRRMANRYMSMLAQSTVMQLDQAVKDQLNRLSPDVRNIIIQVNQQEEQLALLAGRGLPLQFLQEQMSMMRGALERVVQSPTATAEDKEAANTKLAKFFLQDFIGRGDHYFRAAPNQTLRERIHFLLWQKKADDLGIHFTTEDVGRLVRRELFGMLRDEVQTAVQRQMASDMQGFSMSACLKALGEEFRVREAQIAILGPSIHGNRADKTYGATPVFNPPYEVFAFYREQCSPTSYAAIPVPAANLLAEVERRLALPAGDPQKIAEPTENELRSLFDKHKDDMFNPVRETPGFKDPPRISVEWFQLTGEEPYYKAEAEKALKNELVQANLSAVLSVRAFGPAPGITALNARAFIEDPLLARQYAQTVQRHDDTQATRYSNADVDFLGGFIGRPILESSIVRPGVPAVAVGGMGGHLAAFGNPFAVAGGVVSGPMLYEIRDRVRVGIPAVLGTVPTPGLFNTAVGGAVAYHTMLPKPLPIEAYRGAFMQNLIAERARNLALGNNQFGSGTITGDLNTFIEEVNKLSEKGLARDMEPAKKYISEFLAKRGLTLHSTEKPRTEWDLEDDPAMAPLVAAQKESLHDPRSPHRSDYMPFGRSFFWDVDQLRGTLQPVSGRYVPRPYPETSRFADDSKARFVVWRSAELNAISRTFDDTAKAIVKDAWKRLKARELARAKAEALAEGIREHVKAIEAGGTVSEVNLIPHLRDEAEKLRTSAPADTKAQRRALPFPIRGVCPLTSVTGNPTSGVGLLGYEFAPPNVSQGVQFFALMPSENIKYPTNEFQNTIMEKRTEPPGTVLVLPDAPKDTYYVLTLVKREERTVNDYLQEVASGTGRGAPMIMSEFRRETERNAGQSIYALLKQEFNYEETDEQKKRLDEDERRGGES